jgi:16S rRNA (adenine1518-N6/adenine1519-N6)-dimethyltransferase
MRVRTRKRLGQHFLEPEWIRKVLDAISPREDQDFLEIGPGMGALTLPLSAAARRIAAIEIDSRFAGSLRSRNLPNVAIVHGNALDEDLGRIVDRECTQPFRIVGNLPYYVVTPLIFRILDLARSRRIDDAVLMVQREVGDRLVAGPGSKAYGVLTVQLALRADVERLFNLPPGAFRPVPEVSSSLVQIRFRRDPMRVPDQEVFDRMLTAVFGRRRKTMLNAFRPFAEARGRNAAELLTRAGIDGRRRPETLRPDEFVTLSGLFVSA